MRSCQVFISHSSWDEAAASVACSILERRGISCWVAARDIGPNQDFTSAVVAAIDRCDVLLLVLSSRANSSHHIMKEVQRAAAQHKLVAVLRIEDIQPTKLEFFFSGVCWLDAVNSSIEAALAGFVEETGLLVDRNESCGGAERVNRSVASGTLRGSLPSRSEGQRAAPQFDVFISYRRGSDAQVARLVRAELQRRHFRVFLDVDDLDAGHFDEAIMEHIRETPNFILVLSPSCLDRCGDADDWLRREVTCALGEGHRLIPLMMPGFSFPAEDRLPEDLRPLRKYQGVHYSHEFFEAMIQKVVRYLDANSSCKPPSEREANKELPHGGRVPGTEDFGPMENRDIR